MPLRRPVLRRSGTYGQASSLGPGATGVDLTLSAALTAATVNAGILDVTGDSALDGQVVIGGGLGVVGKDLVVNGPTLLNGAVDIDGAFDVDGATDLGGAVAISGGDLVMGSGRAVILDVGSTGDCSLQWPSDADTGLIWDSANHFRAITGGNVTQTWSGGTSNFVSPAIFFSYLEIRETTAPSGLANAVRIYAVDDGGGKTDFTSLFGSGAAQPITGEP